jgi:hypothetical protein
MEPTMIHVCLTVTLALSQTPPTAPDATAVPKATDVPAATAVPNATAAPAVTAVGTTPAERRNTASLTAAIDSLCARYPTNMVVSNIGNSAGRRPIPVLTLSANPSTAGDRPAILMLAGMDGPRWSGTEAALIAAEAIARDHADMLRAVTVYVIPRGNPDAAEGFSTDPRRDYSGDGIVHDNDRDGNREEDRPRDLNGDGLITQIRASANSTPWTAPTLVADAAELRLLRAPDAKLGEIPVYAVWTEGIDTDGDGRIAEDWLGGIDPERNFPHRWPEFEDEAGSYPLIAPESKAIADFVMSHPTIFAAFVLGRHDTVINVPDGKARTPGGMPVMIDEADVATYAELAKSWREISGQKRADARDSAGSFVAWMNAQRGVPTFASTLWGRPDAPPAAETPKPADAANADKAADKKADKKDVPKPADAEAAAWLEYSDRVCNGAGFVPWTRMDHPQLRNVEVGGWVPGFRENPPIVQVPALGDACAKFIAAIAEARPMIAISEPAVLAVGPSLWRIETRLTNTGRLPSVMRGGRADLVTPAHVIRLSAPMDRIQAGNRNDVIRGIDAGSARVYSWLVNVPPGEEVAVELLYNGKSAQRWAFRDGEKIEAEGSK